MVEVIQIADPGEIPPEGNIIVVIAERLKALEERESGRERQIKEFMEALQKERPAEGQSSGTELALPATNNTGQGWQQYIPSVIDLIKAELVGPQNGMDALYRSVGERVVSKTLDSTINRVVRTLGGESASHVVG